MYKNVKMKLELAKFLQQTAMELKHTSETFEGDFTKMLSEVLPRCFFLPYGFIFRSQQRKKLNQKIYSSL